MRKLRLLSACFTVLFLIVFILPACQSGPSKAEMYARENNLPEQDIIVLSQLELDANAQSLIGQLSSLPPGVQKDKRTLDYLKEVSADRRESGDELARMDIATRINKLSGEQASSGQYVPYNTAISYVLNNKNPNLAKAYDYLSSVSDKALKGSILFGIDDNVTDFILFAASLPDRKFSQPVHYDQAKQAEKIGRTLDLIFQSGVEGVYIFAWDRAANFNEQNRLGFGIWDYVRKEPKLGFWAVYKYYKE